MKDVFTNLCLTGRKEACHTATEELVTAKIKVLEASMQQQQPRPGRHDCPVVPVIGFLQFSSEQAAVFQRYETRWFARLSQPLEEKAASRLLTEMKGELCVGIPGEVRAPRQQWHLASPRAMAGLVSALKETCGRPEPIIMWGRVLELLPEEQPQ